MKFNVNNIRLLRNMVFEEHEEEQLRKSAEDQVPVARKGREGEDEEEEEKEEVEEEEEEEIEEMQLVEDIGELAGLAKTAKRANLKAEAMVELHNIFMKGAGRALPSPKRISVDIMQRAIDACAWKPREVLPPAEEKAEEEALISCILFGVRSDKTRIKSEEEEGEDYYSAFRTERHITLTSEPGGAYVGHLVAASDDPRAIADVIYAFLVKYGIDESLVYFGGVGGGNGVGGVEGDGEVADFLEERLGHRLVRVVCELDTNDISLRRVVEEIAGPYRENNPGMTMICRNTI